MAVEAMQSIAHDRTMVLLLMVLALLVLGTFMDMAPLIIIATPIFLPVARAYGVDPVHFGVILILSCGIGLLTPPVGSVLFIGAAIGKIDVARDGEGPVAVLHRHAGRAAGGGAVAAALAEPSGMGPLILRRSLLLAGAAFAAVAQHACPRLQKIAIRTFRRLARRSAGGMKA